MPDIKTENRQPSTYNRQSGLYIVPTPIGNLDDITIRAKKILQSVDIIACEDTRHTGNLLKLLGISHNKLESFHEHNEYRKSGILLNELKKGKSVALVTDAGTPGISDPGYKLIHEAINHEILVIPLPGATAFVPALLASGFACHQFKFWGFPPQKKGRKAFLEKVSQEESTSILYESPYKILKLLTELAAFCGYSRNICIAREISKVYEEFTRGTIKECNDILIKRDVHKGEFVIVIEGISSLRTL